MVTFIVLLSLLLTVQGILTLIQMVYSWQDPEKVAENKSPLRFAEPKYSFTALIPARHEENVIAHTIKAIAGITYPEYLKETLILCRYDDYRTILKAQKAIDEVKLPNIHVVTFDGDIVNKPHALNIGLKRAEKDIVVVFDAEDEPHRDIYKIVNTVLVRDNPDVIQSGVQLMNFRSNWFSTLNVLEYFFWFKSSLQFFANLGFILLGGNTVFIKKYWLRHVGGWDEACLTEDADLGIRLSITKAKMKVIYDELHTTREETPGSVSSFIKQRTRWNQGFLQVFFKGDWLKLPKLSQKLIAAYSLTWPIVQALLFIITPLSIYSAVELDMPVWVTILSSLPLYILMLQFVTYNIGLFEFTRDYRKKYPFWMPLKLLVTFYPFQVLLGVSTLRAALRMLFRVKGWEKTTHTNAHRSGNSEDFGLPNLFSV